MSTGLKSIILFLFILFVFLQYKIWFAPGNILELFEFEQTIASIADKNNKLRKRNRILEATIQDLKKDEEAVEDVARNDLGMIKEGETFYKINFKAPIKDLIRKN